MYAVRFHDFRRDDNLKYTTLGEIHKDAVYETCTLVGKPHEKEIK